MDALQGFGELGMGSRLKRLSEHMMRESQLVYDEFNIDFDPYLFPTFKIIKNKNGVTNTEINNSLKTSQPATTQVINKLLKKELIILKEDKTDKRKKIVYLSKKGKDLVKNISPIWNSIEQIIKEYTTITSNSLIEHLNILEEKFNQKRFSDAIIEHIKMNTEKNNLEIVTYQDSYAKNFYDLNIEWLKTYFYVEPYDEEVLSNPDKYIINKDGHIFFAKLNNEIVGTVALMPMDKNNEFELTKMAVSPKHRGHKIGQQLMQNCIDFAREKNYDKLILYSNKILENAIYIYRKYGFIEIPMEKNSPYKRGDIKMKLKIQ
ncbi:MarR family transcriptional regulator with acetyltransferase activity [Tenacibaculum adriaticum]|uniref:MarR family transcriptional regulator with acetyltransferase activity n=1 Tax=Tenacibaculum adriaticum TaxID=413713 RepID=A0A5S5DU16_9FLAO|nr:bifunctional helix-turn-helix transcriptional regulator/GNAT family N-acetyltransferase [Tenacibaculum adriaticum]TYP98129.1 MarR family transcriptional regulator with acetyltransferase activity [Tenacibaculum adriaticum]